MAVQAVPSAGRPPSGRARGSTSRTGGGRSRKRRGGGQSVAEATSVAMKTALLDIEPLLSRGGSEKSEWRLKQEEEESKSAALDTKAAAYALQKAMCADHQKYSEQIVEEEGQKRPGYQTRVKFMEQMVAKLEKEMFGGQ